MSVVAFVSPAPVVEVPVIGLGEYMDASRAILTKLNSARGLRNDATYYECRVAEILGWVKELDAEIVELSKTQSLYLDQNMETA